MSNCKNFDIKCYDLACVFLDDCKGVTEAKRNDLAYSIQQAIEDWLEDQDTAREAAAYGDYIDRKIR